MPQFVVSQLGTWEVGRAAVSTITMYRFQELAQILTDPGANFLVAMQDPYRNIAALILHSTQVRKIMTTSELEYRSSGLEPRSSYSGANCPGTIDMATMLVGIRGPRKPGPSADEPPAQVARRDLRGPWNLYPTQPFAPQNAAYAVYA